MLTLIIWLREYFSCLSIVESLFFLSFQTVLFVRKGGPWGPGPDPVPSELLFTALDGKSAFPTTLSLQPPPPGPAHQP